MIAPLPQGLHGMMGTVAAHTWSPGDQCPFIYKGVAVPQSKTIALHSSVTPAQTQWYTEGSHQCIR